MIRRKEAFQFLLADSTFATDAKELSQHELEMISSIADTSSLEGKKFWATAFAIQALSDWGVSVSVWNHQCACSHHVTDKEKGACKLKGRRAIQLACGQWQKFVHQLNSLSLTPTGLAHILQLKNQDPSDGAYADFLLTEFQNCKAEMEFKAKQSWSFWSSLPFSILEMCKHWVEPEASEESSRARARELMMAYGASPSKASLTVVAFHFFGNEASRKQLEAWAVAGDPLHPDLMQLLVGYISSLTVMQRLEGRHHFVNLALSRGRALSPPAVQANLRRRFNRDMVEESFRNELPVLLNQFDQLVPTEWTSKKSLHEQVYGHGLEQLHPNVGFEQQQMFLHSMHTEAVETSGKIVAWS